MLFAVRFTLVILLMLFAALSHPARLAVERSVCGPAEKCPGVCPCCAAGACHCAMQDQTPPPHSPAPVRIGDFYPVPALPPVCQEVSPAVVAAGKKAVSRSEWNDGVLPWRRVPLFVRHCAWLM
jgi:hypothetical protein